MTMTDAGTPNADDFPKIISVDDHVIDHDMDVGKGAQEQRPDELHGVGARTCRER